MRNVFKRLLKHPLCIKLLGAIIAGYIKLVFKTTQWQRIGWQYPESYWHEHKSFITCFWHNRLLMTCFAWQGPQQFHMLISGHADGQLIAETVAHYNIATIVGSRSKGGSTALRSILRVLKNGMTIGVTPDGPRGPRFEVSDGIVAMAKLSKLDIIPVTYSTQHRVVMQSWDRFILALPLGKGVLAWGEPIPYTNDYQLDHIKSIVQQRLLQLNDEADKLCGHLPLR